MITRSASSRRRRASRSAASSPQARPTREGSCSASTSPGRRASIAVSPVDPERDRTTICVEINRSPRHSIIPDINFESRGEYSSSESPPSIRSPRGSLVPDSAFSPRNSLVPDQFNRSPRNSLVPSDAYSRSPRNSLVPEAALSPRNSLTPDCYNRSPRSSLTPESISRSPRHSLVPAADTGHALSPGEFNRSPRNSMVPESTRELRSQRHSLVPSDSAHYFQRSPVHDDPPRKYSLVSVSEIAPHAHNRSPRGSIAPETLPLRTSPRGSIGGDFADERHGRERSPRGSLGSNRLLAETIEPGAPSSRTPRGSLTLTFQEPPTSERRSSADNPSGGRSGYGRSASPYRSARVNHGYSTSGYSDGGSRRASSSVSQVNLTQVSGDEQRRLCNESALESGDVEQTPCLSLGITLTTYGSVAYQLKDANMEASGTCDFVFKALRIVNRTVAVTVLLVCLSTLSVLMLIMGVQFLRDCPREPRIPVYLVVGGGMGCLKSLSMLYQQLHTRRIDLANPTSKQSVVWRVLNFCLTVFLLVWFGMGNYWILRIKWPDYNPTLFEPNRWCHRSVYVFSLVQLYIVYGLMSFMFLLVVILAGCQIAGCSWLGPARYK